MAPISNNDAISVKNKPKKISLINQIKDPINIVGITFCKNTVRLESVRIYLETIFNNHKNLLN
ncbi:unnamed protein product [marine sediment metagenome]|uniref:Uncharacterized protein n=1 Tax=marine sediment metagenome TaxID=412755 RepID=X1E162_9ZZZZ